jgi:hypothetical protein
VSVEPGIRPSAGTVAGEGIVFTVEGSTVTFPVFGEVTCPGVEFEDGGVITLPGGKD